MLLPLLKLGIVITKELRCGSDTSEVIVNCVVTYDIFVLNHVRSWFVAGWIEILRDYVGLPGLYGLKFRNLITSMIVFVPVLL